MKSKGIIAVAILGLGALLFFGFKLKPQVEVALGKSASELRFFGGDVIGSRTGTSTPVGVCFSCQNGGMTATTSYVKKIGTDKKIATYQFNILGVSTTPALQFDVQGSNDYGCETTATSAGDEPLVSEIQWYGIDNLRNVVATSPFVSGSSTAFVKATTVVAGNHQTLTLTDLNFECLKLNVRASSTYVYAGLTTK